MLGELPARILQLYLEALDALVLGEVVPLEELLLDLLVAVGDGAPHLEQVQVGDVVLLLLADVLLAEVGRQLGGYQLQVLLPLAVRLLPRQDPLLRLDEVHHQPLEGLVEDLPQVLVRHCQLGLQGHDLVAEDLGRCGVTPLTLRRSSSFSFPLLHWCFRSSTSSLSPSSTPRNCRACSVGFHTSLFLSTNPVSVS